MVGVSTNIIDTIHLLSRAIYQIGKRTYYQMGYPNLVATGEAPRAFVKKIKGRMDQENIGIRELARKLHLSHPTITELVTYGKKPSFDTCIALSDWLGQSPILTLREAGLLPEGTSDTVRFEDWEFLLNQLPPEEQEELRQIAELKIERRRKAEAQAAAAKRRPARSTS